MSAVAKYGSPNPVSKLPDGHNRVGSGYICIDSGNIKAGDALCLVPNSTATTAGVPTMGVARADATGGDLAKAVVIGFAPMDALYAQADAITILRDVDFNYGVGFMAAFLTAAAGPVYVYLSGSVKGGLDTAPAWPGAQPIGLILDDNRIRLFGNYGYTDSGDPSSILVGVRNDEFAVAATAGNGGAFAWQNNFTTPVIIPVGGLTLDVQTVASSACTASFGEAASGTTAGTNLLNAQDVHTATGLFSNTAAVKVPAAAWVTGTLSAPTAFVGNVLLTYRIVPN